MIKYVNIDEIIYNKNIVFIDVRSEKEFGEDTINGAINIPILNNEEREHVGYLYKQIDKDEAKQIGIEYASKKLPYIYSKVKEIININKDIALFCYRGGMRSNSVANILSTMGLDVYLINGGYKTYRKFIMEQLNLLYNKFKFIVLHGYTGVGKTKILQMLSNKGEPVLNLELLAKNRGSVFGNIGYEDLSINQKKFESSLFQILSNSKKNYIFVESESKRIGKIILSDILCKNMEKGYHILLNTNMQNRISNILDDYINITDEHDSKLIEGINKLRKRISNEIADDIICKLKEKKYGYVAEKLMIHYYDPLYKYSIDKIKYYDKIINYEDFNDAVDELIDFRKNVIGY